MADAITVENVSLNTHEQVQRNHGIGRLFRLPVYDSDAELNNLLPESSLKREFKRTWLALGKQSLRFQTKKPSRYIVAKTTQTPKDAIRWISARKAQKSAQKFDWANYISFTMRNNSIFVKSSLLRSRFSGTRITSWEVM